MADEKRPTTLSSKSLDWLLGQGSTNQTTWMADEAQSLLRHQLESPLGPDLKPLLDRSAPGELPGDWELQTFRELLLDENANPRLLESIKDLGKQLGSGSEAALRDVGTVLYYLAIARARISREQDITSLPDAEISKGCAWCIAQEWLDNELADLLRRCAKSVDG
jgi:hypothetical protein